MIESSRAISPRYPYAFIITTRCARRYAFAVLDPVDLQRWLTAFSNASYPNMFQRTRDAVRFLERCRDLTAPWTAGLYLQAIADGVEGATAASGISTMNLAENPQLQEAALKVDITNVPEGKIKELKTDLQGGDVILAIQQLLQTQQTARLALEQARINESVLRSQIDDMQSTLAIQDRDYPGRGDGYHAMIEPDGLSRAEANDLRKELDAAIARATALANKNATLEQELQASSLAAAKATRATLAATQGAGSTVETMTALSKSHADEVSALKAHISKLEQDLKLAKTQTQNFAITAPAKSPAAETSPDPGWQYEHEWASYFAEAQRLEKLGK